MRILLVADLHYSLKQYDWVIDRAGDYDAVVLAGDALSIAAPVPIEAQIVAVRTTLAHLAQRTQLLFCSGNHDLNGFTPAGEKTADWLGTVPGAAVTVDGQSTEIGGVLFTVVPWWDGDEARAGVERLLDQVSARRSGRWVWVYHSPPESRLSWTGSRHYGDTAVAGWIDRWSPDVLLCGHIHQAPFTPDGSWWDRAGTTWLFNPGKQMGSVPSWVDLDLSAGHAAWGSAMGIEECRIDLVDGPRSSSTHRATCGPGGWTS